MDGNLSGYYAEQLADGLEDGFPVASITVEFAEGPCEFTKDLPLTFETWDAADEWFDKLVAHLEPGNGVYKVDVKLTWPTDSSNSWVSNYRLRPGKSSNLRHYVEYGY